MVEADQGKYLRVRVSFQDDDGNAETATSDATGPVAAEPNESATGQPTISGTARVGEDLSASVSGISDGNGLATVSYGYQWLRGETAAAAGSDARAVRRGDGGRGGQRDRLQCGLGDLSQWWRRTRASTSECG